MDRQREYNGVVIGNIPEDIHEDVRGASPGAVRESFHGGEKGITLGRKRGDNLVGVRETTPSSAIMHEPMYDPPVPFMQRVGGLCPNNIVFIAGHINQNPKRVTINLQCGNDVIAFHFDIRFNYGSPRNVIVRNTKKNGWGQEERTLPYGPFPFKPDMNFEIIILAETNCFKVAVNNQHLLEYKHRVQPLDRIDTLSIVGDLRLTQFRFQR